MSRVVAVEYYSSKHVIECPEQILLDFPDCLAQIDSQNHILTSSMVVTKCNEFVSFISRPSIVWLIHNFIIFLAGITIGKRTK
jgi:hypothetical protein